MICIVVAMVRGMQTVLCVVIQNSSLEKQVVSVFSFLFITFFILLRPLNYIVLGVASLSLAIFPQLCDNH